jgi:hypothetical protein
MAFPVPPKSRLVAIVCTVAASGLFGVAIVGVRFGLSPTVPRDESSGARATGAAAALPGTDARHLEQCLSLLMDARQASQAVVALRDHVVRLNQGNAPQTAATMHLVVDGIAKRYSKLDTSTRSATLALVTESFAWHGQHVTTSWPGLLAPTKEVIREALGDPERPTRLHALRFARECWLWSPPQAESPEQRKALGSWKAELHGMCVELLKASDPEVRAEAAFTVGSAPVAEAAGKALPMLQDPHADVRRQTLLALADRPEVLPSEEVLSLLHDASFVVRTTARIVLSCRGLEQQQISLGAMATSAKVAIRAQAARHIALSEVVDRSVWLMHLSRDSDASVRVEAAGALARLNDELGWARVADLSREDGDPLVRTVAARLLQGRADHSPSLVLPAAN